MREGLITVFIVITAPMTTKETHVTFQQAMKNPMSVFGTPEALEAAALATAEKRAILLQWQDQLQKLLIADDESMLRANAQPGANAECLRRITDILTRLTPDDR